MQETKKSMDRVGEEATQLYKEHLGAAAVADAMGIVADERAKGRTLLINTQERNDRVKAENEADHAWIDAEVMAPTVAAGENHFNENSEAYHRLAAMEDYDRNQAKKQIAVEQPDQTGEQVPVTVDQPNQK